MNETDCPRTPFDDVLDDVVVPPPSASTSDVPWLDADEMRAWLSLNAAMRLLPAALDADLRERAQLSLFEYLVLAMLSESPTRQRSCGELARLVDGSMSRLSHVLDRLQAGGLVERCQGADDKRQRMVTLTDAGFDRLVAVAPDHVRTVRALVFDGLTPDEVAVLEKVTALIAARSRR